jgi:hypothetical protein
MIKLAAATVRASVVKIAPPCAARPRITKVKLPEPFA